MAVKLNTEFNYRYQVQGETIWEKIKHLQNFLVGRKRAAGLEQVDALKLKSRISKLEYLKKQGGLEHEILDLEAEILEKQSFSIGDDLKNCYELNRQEIAILERLLEEAFLIAEPTRIAGYTDEQMFEANAANEFTAMIAKDIQSELIAYGHPSAAKVRNAMSNPITWNACIQAGLIPMGNEVLKISDDPVKTTLFLPDKKEG